MHTETRMNTSETFGTYREEARTVGKVLTYDSKVPPYSSSDQASNLPLYNDHMANPSLKS